MNNNVFDPLAWANNSANSVNANEKPQNVASHVTNPANAPLDDELAKAQAVADELIRKGANIAESYDDYLHLGFALAEGLGPQGRDLYHRLCSQSTKYRESDCEKKWEECIAKQDGRVTIKTFYKMAQDAGVDLSEIGRRFPPFTPLRQGSAEHDTKSFQDAQTTVDNSSINTLIPHQPTSAKSMQSGGGVAEMAEFSPQEVEQALDASALANPTFSDKLNIGDLPPILRDAAQKQTSSEGRDKVILSMLNLASGFTPNVCGIYDRRQVFPPFYDFIVAPSGADKGIIPACLALIDPIVREIRSRYEAAHHEYIKKKAAYDALSKKENLNSATL